ncbi:MAG: glutamate racemase [Methylophilaceae bacterium]|nr:glutamate racemase [Methylophilaceae bacterium]
MHNHLQQIKHTNIQANSIGVMDSGVGGLSVLQHIHALLPHENLMYFADSLHAPYGSKTPKQIQRRVFSMAKFLLSKGVKALVIACNTATAAAAQDLRDQYAFLNIPIIAMEPAVKPASLATKNGVVGVLATVGTLKSAQFAALLANYGQDIQVYTQGCVGLVECIERGEINNESTKALISQYCAPLLAAGADSIVLGCTHYPFVRKLIQAVVGDGVTIIDTGAAVAKHLQATLEAQDLLTRSDARPDVSIWTNHLTPNGDDVIRQLCGHLDVIIRPILSR